MEHTVKLVVCAIPEEIKHIDRRQKTIDNTKNVFYHSKAFFPLVLKNLSQ
jgi:hypothetical protein